MKIADEFATVLSGMDVGGDWYFILHSNPGGKVYYDSTPLNYHRRHRGSIAGKILDQKGHGHIVSFLRDYEINLRFVIQNFRLSRDYLPRLERYLNELWQVLAHDMSFDEFHQHLHLNEIKEEILQAQAHGGQ